jgi:hypothetical protein
MLQIIQSLIVRCELSVRKDAKGTWQVCAKGPLAIIALVLLVVLYRHV